MEIKKTSFLGRNAGVKLGDVLVLTILEYSGGNQHDIAFSKMANVRPKQRLFTT